MKTLVAHRQFFTLILTLLLTPFVLVGCGEIEEENNQPAIAVIPDQTLGVGDTLSMAVHITDADSDDTHTIRAVSNDASVATATVIGRILSIWGIGDGVATIIIDATDDSRQENAAATPVLFRVTVKKNNQPVIAAISDQTLDVDDRRTVVVNITDADLWDTHIIGASSDDTAIATVAVNGITLTITGREGGVATITVDATDDSRQENAAATPITFRVSVGCQILPLDEDYEGTPIVFGAGNRGCVLLSDGNLVAVACFWDKFMVAGGSVLTSRWAPVKFAGGDLINERFALIPDGKLSEFEVGKPRSGTIKVLNNGFRFVVDVPKQDFETIAGDLEIRDYFLDVDGVCEVRPRLNRDLVEVLTGLVEDMIFIMRNN